MQLLWSSRSPFARKVMVAAHELGIADRITRVRVLVSAPTCNAEVMRHNPLGRIPTLLLEDGTALIDSAAIIEFLDTTLGGGQLLPAVPERRWPALQMQALGDGLMSLSVLRHGERNRGALASRAHAEAIETKMAATLDVLETRAGALAASGAAPLGIGGIAVACALAHLDFRFAGEDWRIGRPALLAWHAAVSRRPSMLATGFVEQY